MIIFAGTAAAVLIAFPASTIKTIPKLMTIIFKEIDRKKQSRNYSTIYTLGSTNETRRDSHFGKRN